MPAKKIMYVVGTVDFQYNDETYYAPEGDAVRPVTVYRTKEAAEKAALEQSLKAMADWDLLSFGYSDDEIFSDPEAALELYQAAGYEGSDLDDLHGGYSNEFVQKMNDEQRKKLLDLLTVTFATVSEVEVGE